MDAQSVAINVEKLWENAEANDKFKTQTEATRQLKKKVFQKLPTLLAPMLQETFSVGTWTKAAALVSRYLLNTGFADQLVDLCPPEVIKACGREYLIGVMKREFETEISQLEYISADVERALTQINLNEYQMLVEAGLKDDLALEFLAGTLTVGRLLEEQPTMFYN